MVSHMTENDGQLYFYLICYYFLRVWILNGCYHNPNGLSQSLSLP